MVKCIKKSYKILEYFKKAIGEFLHIFLNFNSIQENLNLLNGNMYV